jgi:8-oxo-dGTP diphosphatase
MTAHDGNGWARCSLGHRHWGRHGAAGLLVAAPGLSGQTAVLLQQRSYWVSQGGAWGPPGGARDSHESAVHAALREAAEECAIVPEAISVHGLLLDDHGGWTFQTVLASAAARFAVTAASDESRQAAWVPVAEVDQRGLHAGFAGQWPVLRAALAPLTIIADIANIMGARPDGWWRDRAGAASRLCVELAGLASRGVTGLPDSAGIPVLDRWFPRIVAVLEGAAKPAAGAPATQAAVAQADGRLRVVQAPGSGDDEIAALAGSEPGHRLVVTADRELRARCQAGGASVVGPGWLLGQL